MVTTHPPLGGPPSLQGKAEGIIKNTGFFYDLRFY